MSKLRIYFLYFPLMLAVFPFVGFLAVVFMICLRWYWCLFSSHPHRASLWRHLTYAASAPLALVGGLVCSAWMPTLLALRGFEVWPWLVDMGQIWNALAMPMVGKILGLITGMHDLIVGILAIDEKWLPLSWWAIAKADNGKEIFQILNSSWAIFLPMLAWFYVLTSYLCHVLMLSRIRSTLSRLKIEEENRLLMEKQKAMADAAEIDRIRSGGIPKMANGKSSALEF